MNGRQQIIGQASEELAYSDQRITTEAGQAAVESLLRERAERGFFGEIGWYWQKSTDPSRARLYKDVAREAQFKRDHIPSVAQIARRVLAEFGVHLGSRHDYYVRDALHTRNPMTGRTCCDWQPDAITVTFLGYTLIVTRETVTWDNHTVTVEEWNRVHGPKLEPIEAVADGSA